MNTRRDFLQTIAAPLLVLPWLNKKALEQQAEEKTNGTIRNVIPTLRGIGVTDARSLVQVDRYSAKSENISIAFLDTSNKFAGWKTILEDPEAWLQYNSVKFEKAIKKITIRAKAAADAAIIIRTGSLTGPVIAEITVPAGNEWKEIGQRVSTSPSGIQHLVMQLKRERLKPTG